MNKNSQRLLKTAAVFGVLGAILGAHMAGAGSYLFRPIHAHILVVGWLTLFSWAIFYKVFPIAESFLTKIHVFTAIFGSIGLTVGMWLYMVKPFNLPESFTLGFYIGGGTLLLISFVSFFFITLFYREKN